LIPDLVAISKAKDALTGPNSLFLLERLAEEIKLQELKSFFMTLSKTLNDQYQPIENQLKLAQKN